MSEDLVQVLDWIKLMSPEGGLPMEGAIGETVSNKAYERGLSMAYSSVLPWLLHWTMGEI